MSPDWRRRTPEEGERVFLNSGCHVILAFQPNVLAIQGLVNDMKTRKRASRCFVEAAEDVSAP